MVVLVLREGEAVGHVLSVDFGAFVGMVAFDITGQGRTADFSRFLYAPDGT